MENASPQTGMELEVVTESAAEKYDRARKMGILLQVLEYQLAHPRAKRKAACEAVGISDRTFRSWMAEGILDDWLTEFSDATKRSGRAIILDNWDKVIKFQLEIATGLREVRGASPTTAANFLRQLAGIGFSIQERAPVAKEMNLFMLPQVNVMVSDGKPQIIEGTIISDEPASDPEP